MSSIKPPQKDADIGMGAYVSGEQGIGGMLKSEPEDFVVAEIMEDGTRLSITEDMGGDDLAGEYTHFTMVKRNWETMRAIKEMAKRLGVSRGRFSYAGTKDKRALTAQRVSAHRIGAEKLAAVSMTDITIKDIGYDDDRLGLGCLWGNAFSIRLRGVADGAAEAIEKISDEVAAGFPNYFGHQRFGDIRPVTHIVGKRIIESDLEGAVMAYLCEFDERETEDSLSARKRLAQKKDYGDALRYFPRRLGYEVAMLNKLAVDPVDFKGALESMPRGLQSMFIHAYQSWVFNRALTRCIDDGLTVERLPLVGADTEPDPISAGILSADGIKVSDFDRAPLESMRSKGWERDCFVAAEDLEVRLEGDDALFDFSLGKGSYATVLLREFTKD